MLTGFPFPSAGFSEQGVRLLRGSNVKRGEVDWSDAITVFWPKVDGEIAKFSLRAGDLVIAMDGALVGRSFATLSEADVPSLLVQRVARLRGRSVVQSLLGQLVASQSFLDHVDSVKTHTAIPHISPVDIRQFAFRIPLDEAEQRVIAAALSDVDALLAKLDQLIAKKRDLKHAAMQQLLTGRTRLAGSSAPWPESSFGEVFEFLRNASNSRADLSASGDVGYVHYGDIHLHSSPFFDARRDLLTFIDAGKVKSTPPLRDGDVLMADASEDTEAIGKAVEITGLGGRRAVGGLHTLVLRPRPGRLARGFAGYVQFMPAVRAALVRAATGVSVYGVSKSSVRAIVTPLPGVEEQSVIAEILSDMGAEIAALEVRRDKTRQLKQGMMQALLTGRIRLT